eukprot:3774070-Pleurochrysis_carterae.AAC.6
MLLSKHLLDALRPFVLFSPCAGGLADGELDGCPADSRPNGVRSGSSESRKPGWLLLVHVVSVQVREECGSARDVSCRELRAPFTARKLVVWMR